MNTTLTIKDVTPELIASIQKEVVHIMKKIGCDVRDNITTPVIRVVDFEEALAEAREEGITESEESLRVKFDSLEAGYSALEHTIYLKKSTEITMSLLAHELVHSCQDEATLIEAGKDCSDVLRLDTWFENEAYIIQSIYEDKNLDVFLVKATSFNMTPYEFLQHTWIKAKPAILTHAETKLAKSTNTVKDVVQQYEEVRENITSSRCATVANAMRA